MKIIGEQFLPAPRLRARELLTDPAQWPDLVAGCRFCRPVGPNEFVVQIDSADRASIYDGRVRLSAQRLFEHCEFSFQWRNVEGGMCGAGTVDLINEGPQTRVRYSAELQPSGVLLQLDPPALEDAARRLIEEFFARAEAQLGSPAVHLGLAQDLAINFVRNLRNRFHR